MSDRYKTIIVTGVSASNVNVMNKLSEQMDEMLNEYADRGYRIKEITPSGEGSIIILEHDDYLESIDPIASIDALHQIT